MHVESNYEFVCFFDDFLSNFGFARTMNNLEFYWQGTQINVVDFFGLGAMFVIFSFQKLFLSGAFWVKKTYRKTRPYFSTPLGRLPGAFGDVFWTTVS